MANIKSAQKRISTIERRNQENRFPPTAGRREPRWT